MSKSITKTDILQAEHDVLSDLTQTVWDCLEKDCDLYRVANMMYVDGVVNMTEELLKKLSDSDPV